MDSQLLRGRSVLVVEDEMLVLMAVEDMLGDLGCTSIMVAGNIDKALELVAAQHFDFATLDVNLNGQRSYAVAAALAARNIPFAFSTGYGEHGVGEGFGDYPVLSKPYTSAQYVAVVIALLASKSEPAGI